MIWSVCFKSPMTLSHTDGAGAVFYAFNLSEGTGAQGRLTQ